ncbi:11539_t:CDS:2 [Ambispora gerdemannii]|uniref:11539_t:CDS:1 n=1 Tax=Ambispora gerdemannii TaxID=144530 RepID=A0A9N9D9S5_9GLOM|nr:11539_t:CDS:2 [Ambispora gerdemannii]
MQLCKVGYRRIFTSDNYKIAPPWFSDIAILMDNVEDQYLTDDVILLDVSRRANDYINLASKTLRDVTICVLELTHDRLK